STSTAIRARCRRRVRLRTNSQASSMSSQKQRDVAYDGILRSTTRLGAGLPNNALKLTRGERGSHSSGAPSRASRARGIMSRRAQLNAVFDGRGGEMTVTVLRPAETPWGDYGDILFHGMTAHLDRHDEMLQLERTGPYMPPITFPGIGDIVVTDAFKA